MRAAFQHNLKRRSFFGPLPPAGHRIGAKNTPMCVIKKLDSSDISHYYTILRANLIGLDGEGIKEIAEVARIEDRNHFEALVPRIYELGGKLPEDMKVFHDQSACPPASLRKNPRRPSRICSTAFLWSVYSTWISN